MSESKTSNDSALRVSPSSIGTNKTSYSAKGQICNENIVTTRDRAALVFHEYVRHREWTTDWLAYLSLSIGLLVSLVTSEFKGFIINEKVLVDGGVCKGIVILLLVGSALLSVFCVIRRIWYREELKCKYFLDQPD